jgi:hypothetical protein
MTSPGNVGSLRKLVNIISDAVDEIEARYSAVGLLSPHLDKPFDPSSPAEVLNTDEDVARNLSLIISAATQLSASCKVPATAVIEHALSVRRHLTSDGVEGTDGHMLS